MRTTIQIITLTLLIALISVAPASAQDKAKCNKSFQECVDQFMGELTQRGWFGVLFGNNQMTPDGEELPDDLAIKVMEVNDDGPAAPAGIEAGDTVIAVNGKKYSNLADLNPVRKTLKVGEEVTLTIERAGEQKEVKLTLAEPPATMVAVWLGDYILENFLVVENEMLQQ